MPCAKASPRCTTPLPRPPHSGALGSIACRSRPRPRAKRVPKRSGVGDQSKSRRAAEWGRAATPQPSGPALENNNPQSATVHAESNCVAFLTRTGLVQFAPAFSKHTPHPWSLAGSVSFAAELTSCRKVSATKSVGSRTSGLSPVGPTPLRAKPESRADLG
jgi:hypothetical protein